MHRIRVSLYLAVALAVGAFVLGRPHWTGQPVLVALAVLNLGYVAESITRWRRGA